jgi:hypothetical protein
VYLIPAAVSKGREEVVEALLYGCVDCAPDVLADNTASGMCMFAVQIWDDQFQDVLTTLQAQCTSVSTMNQLRASCMHSVRETAVL